MAKIRVAGGSTTVTLDPTSMKISGMSVGDTVVLTAEKGQITIKKAEV